MIQWIGTHSGQNISIWHKYLPLLTYIFEVAIAKYDRPEYDIKRIAAMLLAAIPSPHL